MLKSPPPPPKKTKKNKKGLFLNKQGGRDTAAVMAAAGMLAFGRTILESENPRDGEGISEISLGPAAGPRSCSC